MTSCLSGLGGHVTPKFGGRVRAGRTSGSPAGEWVYAFWKAGGDGWVRPGTGPDEECEGTEE